MRTRIEVLQERMAILSDDALRKIIVEDYTDFEVDALDVAKQELNKRISDKEIAYDSKIFIENIKDENGANVFDEVEVEIDIETIKGRMKDLTEDELREIVYLRFREYNKSVTAAAMSELYLRNSDIIDINNTPYIQFKDIISKVTFDQVLSAILSINPYDTESISSYKQVLDQLLKIQPVEENNVLINIEKNVTDNEYWDLFGVNINENEKFEVEFFPWNEWLAFRLPKELVIKYGRENTVAQCLIRMTSYGLNEIEIQQRLTEIENKVSKEKADFDSQYRPLIMLSQNISFESVIARGMEMRNKIFREKAVPQIRPWVRMWARTIDGMIWGLLLYMIWYNLSPYTYTLVNSFWEYISIFSLFFTLVESILLSTWGTTPGKWILNVYVRENNGEKMIYSRALYRSLFVWSFGEGLGIQYLGFVMNIVSYFDLKDKGETRWDGKGQFKVSHKKIGFYRTLIAGSIIISLMLITY